MLVLSLKKNKHLKINGDETIVRVVSMDKKGLLMKTFDKHESYNSYEPGEEFFIENGHSLNISNTLKMTCLKTKGKQMKVGFEGTDEIEQVKGKLKFAIARPRNLDDDFFNFDTEGYWKCITYLTEI